MERSERENLPKIGALEKRRVTMADGRRYLIFYTFKASENSAVASEEKPNEPEARNSAVEEKFENV